MEIERKFLLDKIPTQLSEVDKKIIEQGYISTDPVIRIRRSNDKYILTIKGDGLMAREEFELFISKEQYENLKNKIEHNLIKKTRYIFKEDGYTYEVDEFDEHLSGLLLAEVEFASMEEAESFTPPDWLGKDVSGENTYHNSNLCKIERKTKCKFQKN